MKLSTIYRRAARKVANAQALGRFMGCCRALELVSPITEYDEARLEFRALMADVTWQGGYWWGVCHSGVDKQEFRYQQDARVIALLLAAEVVEGGGS